jgi:STE24 endopeptidase
MGLRTGVWLCLAVVLSCAVVTRAAAQPAEPAAASVVASPGAKAPPYDPAKARAAALIQDPEAATRAYLDAVSDERRQQTKAYATGNYVFQLVDFLVSSALMILLIVLGISVRFRNLARRITSVRAVQSALYWILFFVTITAIQFPLTLYTSYYREKHYGLLTQSLGGFLADQAKSILIGAILGSILVMIIYGVLRRAPRLWWVWLSGVLIAFLILAIAIAPVVISPLFNKFTPIENAELRDSILKMARDHGIPADEVYQMDASTRTDRISAYVNGMLGTMRIVMFDTTLRRCSSEEVQMIMGHEMGHYALNHVWKSVAFLSLVVVIAFVFVRWAFARVLRRWPGTGIEGIADVAGLPLLWLLFSLVVFVATPVVNSFIRWQEMQADNFGLDASRQPDAAATTFLKLGEYRDLEPSPVVELLLFDHPSGRSRIRNAMAWKQAHGAGPR